MSELKSKKKKVTKDVLNIIRTTMRNNIELTHIADNKANVLLTLNSLMITFLIPLILPHTDIVMSKLLYVPLILLIVCALVTIYMAIMVLKPPQFQTKENDIEMGKPMSPFLFRNFYKMNSDEFKRFIESSISDREKLENHIIEDLHFIGVRLGRKLSMIRTAFNVFMFGLFGSIIISFFCLLIF